MVEGTRTLPLWQALELGWIKLPVAVLRDVGPAAQTFGAFVKKTNRETFMAAKDIARYACLPVSTVRKHLDTLDAHGWLENTGRQRTRAGIPRRTCTIKVTKQATDLMTPYNVLPWWAFRSIDKVGRLPWSTKAVLSVVMSRMMQLHKAATRDCPHDDVQEAAEALGGDTRYDFSLSYLMKQTGLGRDGVIQAKRHLHKLGIVKWYSRHDRQDGELLVPNPDCRVVLKQERGEGKWTRYWISLATAK